MTEGFCFFVFPYQINLAPPQKKDIHLVIVNGTPSTVIAVADNVDIPSFILSLNMCYGDKKTIER